MRGMNHHIVLLLLLGVPILVSLLIPHAKSSGRVASQTGHPAAEINLITLDPGHFHAALIQKEMYPGVSRRVSVYSPLGPDLIEHLKRITQFNTRQQNPTNWELDVHTGPDFFERMLKERPGNVVVISGRNQGKIDRIEDSVGAGLNVLADKPWIIAAADLPKLEATLAKADSERLIAYDIMTERFEITTILQRALVNDPDTFGEIVSGTGQQPGVTMESVHHIMKTVAGAANLRPAWFFDINQQGEGFADVGTHLVDLVQWTLFPEHPIDYRRDIRVIDAKRWPTIITRAQFQRATGEAEFPQYLSTNLKSGSLDYYSNNEVSYTLRGVQVKLRVVWNYEAPAGAGDTHVAVFRGTKARLEVRQGKDQNYRPELYVVPNTAAARAEVLRALTKKIESIQSSYPGVAIKDEGEQLLITIPGRYRVDHEGHFAQVTEKFLGYLRNPESLPAWEKANMLAKYYTTTIAVELSRKR